MWCTLFMQLLLCSFRLVTSDTSTTTVGIGDDIESWLNDNDFPDFGNKDPVDVDAKPSEVSLTTTSAVSTFKWSFEYFPNSTFILNFLDPALKDHVAEVTLSLRKGKMEVESLTFAEEPLMNIRKGTLSKLYRNVDYNLCIAFKVKSFFSFLSSAEQECQNVKYAHGREEGKANPNFYVNGSSGKGDEGAAFPPTDDSDSWKVPVIVSTVSGVLLIIICVIVGMTLQKRSKKKSTSDNRRKKASLPVTTKLLSQNSTYDTPYPEDNKNMKSPESNEMVTFSSLQRPVKPSNPANDESSNARYSTSLEEDIEALN